MITVLSSKVASLLAYKRANASDDPPGAKGTIALMVPFGYSACAFNKIKLNIKKKTSHVFLYFMIADYN
jgi:hypothetical protein